MIGATFFECLMSPCTAYGDRTHTPGLRIRYPEPLDQRGLLACPPVDSNHAPSGSEPDVLSAELDGLMKLVDAGGLEPTHGRRLRLYRPDATPVADAIARKVEDSNPRRPRGRRPGFRDQVHAHWCIPSMSCAEGHGIEPSSFRTEPVSNRLEAPSFRPSMRTVRCQCGAPPSTRLVPDRSRSGNGIRTRTLQLMRLRLYR